MIPKTNLAPDPETDLERPEPAPTPYLLPLAELALPPAPMPEEAARLLARAAQRRKTAVLVRDCQKTAYAAAAAAAHPPVHVPMLPPAVRKAAHAAQKVEATDDAANRLKAIREALGDLRGGTDVDPAELNAPLHVWQELHDAIWSGDRFESELALLTAQVFIESEIEEEKARRKAGRKTGNRQRPRRVSATKNVEALRRQYEADPQARLEAIQQACSDIKAGVVGDPLLQAECLRPWPAFYRAVVEIEGVDKLEMFGTALVRMTRALLDEELARERANASPAREASC
jgi:hypothetical protein